MPGKSYREGISLIEIMNMFPDELAAEKWFESIIWSNGTVCPHCGSQNVAQTGNRKPMPWRCRTCRKHFSVRHGTVMSKSRIPLRKWAIAIYMSATSLKSISSMKLHRDLEISQQSAWYLMHRIREAFPFDNVSMDGPVEVDETYMGGKRRNMSNSKRKKLSGRGAVGKTAVVGMKDRETNEVRARVVENTDAKTLQGFVKSSADEGAKVYTDGATAYDGLPFDHESVNHSISEYVRDQAHTNGIESFWALLKRGYHGTFHHVSKKHLNRYVAEFAGRHNLRTNDTCVIMREIVAGMIGKNLSYKDLTQ